VMPTNVAEGKSQRLLSKIIKKSYISISEFSDAIKPDIDFR